MVTLNPGDKIRVDEYFVDWSEDGDIGGYGADLTLNGIFNISAYVVVVIKEGTEFGGQYRTEEFPLYTDVQSDDYDELVDSLQSRVEDLFLPVEKRRYGDASDERRTSLEQIIGVAFSRTGAYSMTSSISLEKGYSIEAPLAVNGDYGISVYSTQSPRDEQNRVKEHNEKIFIDRVKEEGDEKFG